MDKHQEILDRLRLFCNRSDSEEASATFVTAAYLRAEISLDEANGILGEVGIAGPLRYWTRVKHIATTSWGKTMPTFYSKTDDDFCGRSWTSLDD